MVNVPKPIEIYITAPLSYSLITARSLALEKASLIDMQDLGLLVNTLAADEKYPDLHRDNLTIPIQMQLSHKQDTFPQFLLHF